MSETLIYGLGRQASIVAFGLVLDLPEAEVEAVQVLGNAGIGEAFVVDYGGTRRRPNRTEWARWRQFVVRLQRDQLRIVRRKRKLARLEIHFERQIRGRHG